MIKRLVWLGLAGGLLGAVFLGGFAISWFKVAPFHPLAQRIEGKLVRSAGGPTETERKVDVIETTFLRLRGTVYPVPDTDWTNGGALAVWGEDLLVLHRTGRILRLAENGLVDTDIGVPDRGLEAYIALSQTEEWADYTHKPARVRFNDLDYVDDPDGPGLALSYTFFDPDRVCYGTRVAWLPLAPEDRPATLTVAPEAWEVIFETNPCLPLNPGWTALDGIMAGGRMAYRAPGKLILGSGEYHLDGVHTYDVGIQEDDNDYGKVIEIDLATRTSKHLSKGHRNMQGVAVDAAGDVWVTEHGVRGGDELNLIEEGANYGWPLETLGTLYSGQPFPTQGEEGRHVLHTPPVFAWLPSAAVSSLTVIDNFHPTWDGDLLAGSLSSETFGQSLYRVRVQDGRALFAERIELARRIRYLTQYQDKIALWLDSNELVLLEIEPRLDPLAEVTARLDKRYDDVTVAKVSRLLSACGECHSYVESDHAAAPSLNGVVGRRIASVGYPAFSEALQGQGGRWTEEALRAYILDPDGFAAGTLMPNPQVTDDEALTGLIWALRNINTTDDKHLTYN